jgi:hypothetical protein
MAEDHAIPWHADFYAKSTRSITITAVIRHPDPGIAE